MRIDEACCFFRRLTDFWNVRLPLQHRLDGNYRRHYQCADAQKVTKELGVVVADWHSLFFSIVLLLLCFIPIYTSLCTA